MPAKVPSAWSDLTEAYKAALRRVSAIRQGGVPPEIEAQLLLLEADMTGELRRLTERSSRLARRKRP